MNNPDAPYLPPQTAATQQMQQPQSGKPSFTGGAGLGAGSPLPQGPGKLSEQAGSKSLSGLVQQLSEAIQSGNQNQMQAAISELQPAAQAADEVMKQLGLPQYPAPEPPPSELGHPPIKSK